MEEVFVVGASIILVASIALAIRRRRHRASALPALADHLGTHVIAGSDAVAGTLHGIAIEVRYYSVDRGSNTDYYTAVEATVRPAQASLFVRPRRLFGGTASSSAGYPAFDDEFATDADPAVAALLDTTVCNWMLSVTPRPTLQYGPAAGYRGSDTLPRGEEYLTLTAPSYLDAASAIIATEIVARLARSLQQPRRGAR